MTEVDVPEWPSREQLDRLGLMIETQLPLSRRERLAGWAWEALDRVASRLPGRSPWHSTLTAADVARSARQAWEARGPHPDGLRLELSQIVGVGLSERQAWDVEIAVLAMHGDPVAREVLRRPPRPAGLAPVVGTPAGSGSCGSGCHALHALDAATHPYAAPGAGSSGCTWLRPDDEADYPGQVCTLLPGHPRHQTPDMVLREDSR
jgi:hypothetical protein